MIHHNNNGQAFLLLPLPKFSMNHHIKGGDICYGVAGAFNASHHTKQLPPGEWEIVGTGDELTEEQAEAITPCYYEDVEGKIYENYDHSDFISDNALSSFTSLLLSHSLTPANTLVLKRK